MKLFPFLLCFCLISETFAVTVDPEKIRVALDEAPIVADIEILAKRPIIEDKQLFSLSEVKLLDVKRNETSSRFRSGTLSLQTLGGESEGIGTFFSGYPRPYVGQRYRAHLAPMGSGNYQVVGLEAGFVPLNPQRSFSRNRTDGSDGEGDGAFLFWDKSFFPIPYFIAVDTFKDLPQFVSAIDSGFQTWRNVDQVMIEFLPLGCSSSDDNQNDGLNTVILIEKNWPFDSMAIAITRNFYIAGNSARAGLILDSDILLNGEIHEFSTINETGKHDVQNIVTHEIGHFIGLGHEMEPTIDNDATMFRNASVNELNKRTLKENDINGIRSAYQGVSQNKGSSLLSSSPSCFPTIGNSGCARVSRPGNSTPWPFLILLIWVLGVCPTLGRQLIRAVSTRL